MRNIVKKILELLNANFPNGIREDPTDTDKILRLYSEKFPDEIISKRLAVRVIHNFGTEYDGKFYFISDSDISEIKNFFAQLFEKNLILYYASVFDRHSDFFSAKKIFSPEILKKILQKNDDQYFYFPDFVSTKNNTRLDEELHKIFMTAQNLLSLDDLRAIFPYVPTDKILPLLSDTKNFLKTDSGKYLPKNSPTQTIRIFLADKDKISVEELAEFARTLTGSRKSNFEIAIAYETMTRVEKNLFVRDSLVTFDVAATDAALTPFVQGKIISLRNVTSFTDFPSVAPYSWNLFLLESFLRKFSQKFSFDSSSFSSLNTGAIFPKSMHFKNYRHVQAAVVAQENIPLDKNSVDNFLVSQGYRVQRIANVTEDIIRKAKKILTAH